MRLCWTRELASAGSAPLDLSEMLGSDAFDWQSVGDLSEHLKLKGRQAVADRLSQAI